MSIYAAVLQSVPDATRDAVVSALARAFGIKEETSATVIASTPIILIDGLTLEEAAAMQLMLAAITRAGATIDIGEVSGELPKLDWPNRPLIYKREIADYPADYTITLGGYKLIDMLVMRLTGEDPGSGRRPSVTSSFVNAAPSTGPLTAPPATASQPITSHTPSPDTSGSNRAAFTGAELGEITPFSNSVLGDPGSGTQSIAATNAPDLASRMDELFGDETGANPAQSAPQPSAQPETSVGSMLDQILPDDEAVNVGGSGASPALSGGFTQPSGAAPIVSPGTGAFKSAAANGTNGGGGGFSVFLAKIADPNRRDKAVPLLVELSGITEDEAKDLAKKVIIPVLRGVSKDQAEAAKHRFAEIGVLARVRNA